MPGRRQRWRADGPRRRTVLVVLGLLGTGALGVSAAAGAGGSAPADRFTATPIAATKVVQGTKSRTHFYQSRVTDKFKQPIRTSEF